NGTSEVGYVPAVRGGVLELTHEAATGSSGSFIIPALASSSQGFTANFHLFLRDAAGGNVPADGLSFSYGSPSSINIGGVYGEEGPGGTSISWIVDTWNNEQGDQGVRSKVNGANDFVQNFVPLADGATFEGD